MNPTLLILAAGRGSRFGGSKQVFPLGPNGETIMEYSIYDALNNGFGQVVLVINKEVEEEILTLLEAMPKIKNQVTVAFQDLYTELIPAAMQKDRQKPWGTGHAILAARDKIAGAFAMINADDFYGQKAFTTMSEFLKNNTRPSDYSMVGYDLANTLSLNGTVSRGISIRDEQGYLSEINETHGLYQKDGDIYATDKKSGEQTAINEGLASMNFWGFQHNIFEELEAQFQSFLKEAPDPTTDEFYIPFVIDDMIKKELIQVTVLHTDAKWFGVTYREDKDFAKTSIARYIAEGIYPTPLWSQ